MKISGFTIIRNAVLNDYPIVEAIRSILPVVDEMIILVGNSEDDTIGLMQSISDPKIKIHHSVWDPALRTGGSVLAIETNKAFQLIDPESDWAFYIQGDEAVHEQYHQTIRQTCLAYKDDKRVEGLVFKYLHFYGTYDYVGDSRKWYDHEVRIIRNDKKITSYKDAQGFRVGKQKLQVKPVDAYVYHYGWVKSPEQMMKKIKNFSKLWHSDQVLEEMMKAPDFWNYDEFDSLQKFTGTHPAVMHERITRQNWKTELDISKKKFSFKDRLLYHFEKITGIRLFDFRNYRII
ncbi:glycosyltransferase family 2 protein [Sediminibacterium sp.]|uniref:glycosyltransferase family 2 protein n=1 Tax=Sediminibacterium sp. TaxID=1917865 RepID=UPI0025F0BBD9|nr:glycosyltransferase family 2 protein [Sediminibacterium sp.]MBW0179128.1 glycosyltransferase family 2 protein [Sediminibacterium sp.]